MAILQRKGKTNKDLTNYGALMPHMDAYMKMMEGTRGTVDQIDVKYTVKSAADNYANTIGTNQYADASDTATPINTDYRTAVAFGMGIGMGYNMANEAYGATSASMQGGEPKLPPHCETCTCGAEKGLGGLESALGYSQSPAGYAHRRETSGKSGYTKENGDYN